MDNAEDKISYVTKDSDWTEAREVVVAKEIDEIDALKIAHYEQVRHVLHSEGDNLDKSLNSSLKILNEPSALFDAPLETIFGPGADETIETIALPFRRTSDKKRVLTDIISFMKSNRVPTVVLDKVTLASDELFTNALFNAPVESESETIRRTAEIELDEDAEGLLLLGIHQDRLAVVCIDQFGSLDTKKYIRRILSCYEKGVRDSVNLSLEGGAGIGSYLMYGLCISMYLAVKKDKETLVAFVFSTDRKKNQTPCKTKSIHLSAPTL